MSRSKKRRNNSSSGNLARPSNPNAVRNAGPDQNAVAGQIRQELTITEESMWSGPIPSPEDLNSIEALVPGGAKQLLDMAQSRQNHLQEQEREQASFAREIQGREMTLREEDVRANIKRISQGGKTAIGVAVGVFAVAIFLIVKGYYVGATTILTALLLPAALQVLTHFKGAEKK